MAGLIEKEINDSLRQAQHMKMTMDFVYDRLLAQTKPVSQPKSRDQNQQQKG